MAVSGADIVGRLKEIGMGDWIKTGLGIVGVGIVLWASVQQHGFRLDKIEQTLTVHLEKHEEQNEKIQQALVAIQLEMRSLQARSDRNP